MTLLVVHLVLVAGYAGFQWTVRFLVYPRGPRALHLLTERLGLSLL
ncbi:hypothetical protein SAMN05660485_01336 [Blastococcus fimeti]|nr:hypothetical protein SAMN05660485_01336 [Blastococcus fimeti]